MKKTLAVTSLVVLFCSASVGCKAEQKAQDAPDYSITGTVYSKWIDYDCGQAMTPMAFEAVPARTTSGTTGSTNSNNSSNNGNSNKVPTQKQPPKKNDGAVQDNGSDGGTSGGVGLDKQKKQPTAPAPIAPSKVPTGTPKKPNGYSAKWCTDEPELYVKNGEGIFEQDVLQAEYDACAVRDKFPACIG